MHCSVKHWQELDDKNWVSAAGWRTTIKQAGLPSFRETAYSMIEGVRPLERGAMVVMGAAFPKDLKIRRFLKKFILEGADDEFVVAAIYGLGAHMDFDENLRDKLLVQELKWKKSPTLKKGLDALAETFFIWNSSDGTGRCASCASRSER